MAAFGALNQKLLRDLWLIKGQLVAIILVMAAGIAMFVLMFGVLDGIKLSRDTYYDRYQFADVFCSLQRAPQAVKQQLQDIPGVSVVQTRVVFGVTLQMDDMDEPASGKIISLPDGHQPLLNQLYLSAGRRLHANEQNAVLVDERFFIAHQLVLGDKVAVVMNGHKRQLHIVGVVLSPEYVYSIAPGAMMPDPRRYGVFWMSRRSLEAAVNMKGAFNDVALRLERGADVEAIIDRVNRVLKPYGGLIAYGQDEQLSGFFVNNEIKQLDAMGVMAPVIFLAVAAFLINVVISRQVTTQREQIGMLKAVGYTDAQIAMQYVKMVLLISACGAVLGGAVGVWMGVGMTEMYTEFFHFPILKYHFSLQTMIVAVLCCSLAALLGTVFAIRRAAQLPPAEAMRVQSPLVFKVSALQRLGVHNQLSFLSRVVLRQLERRSWRAVLSTLGMAMALSILVFSFFIQDTLTYLMDVQYDITQREDLNVAFTHPRSYQALEEIRVLPGVLAVEPRRDVAVMLKHRHWQKRTSITGLVHQPDLTRVIDPQLKPLPVADNGLMINSKLAQVLGLEVGDMVQVEVLDEKRQLLHIPVISIIEEYLGLGAYMNIRTLNRLLDEPPKITGVGIMVDANHSALLYKKIKQIPSIVGLNIVSVLRQIFEDIMAESLLQMVTVNILFASFICFGVIYNTARIALSERGRELATLRVLGLTQFEVAYILFGELMVITVASIPLGLWIGRALGQSMMASMDSELFRIPFYIETSTYATAVLVVLSCTCISFYLVWRQVDAIDLVSAQKGVQ